MGDITGFMTNNTVATVPNGNGISVSGADSSTIQLNVDSNIVTKASHGIEVQSSGTSVLHMTVNLNFIDQAALDGIFVQTNDTSSLTTQLFANWSGGATGGSGLFLRSLSSSMLDVTQFGGNLFNGNAVDGMTVDKGAGTTMSIIGDINDINQIGSHPAGQRVNFSGTTPTVDFFVIPSNFPILHLTTPTNVP